MGDFDGHPFRGNQYTAGQAVAFKEAGHRGGGRNMGGRATLVGRVAGHDQGVVTIHHGGTTVRVREKDVREASFRESDALKAREAEDRAMGKNADAVRAEHAQWVKEQAERASGATVSRGDYRSRVDNRGANAALAAAKAGRQSEVASNTEAAAEMRRQAEQVRQIEARATGATRSQGDYKTGIGGKDSFKRAGETAERAVRKETARRAPRPEGERLKAYTRREPEKFRW